MSLLSDVTVSVKCRPVAIRLYPMQSCSLLAVLFPQRLRQLPLMKLKASWRSISSKSCPTSTKMAIWYVNVCSSSCSFCPEPAITIDARNLAICGSEWQTVVSCLLKFILFLPRVYHNIMLEILPCVVQAGKLVLHVCSSSRSF